MANAVETQKSEVIERIATSDIPIGQYLTEIAAKLIWIRREINKVILRMKFPPVIPVVRLKF